ncbi:hypothetical protein [Streptomyces sp. NPDC048172]|uniref:hypothetical protein n=1 Tax=Streptomyces sp. NPDC048172 TaxID=3365505 RepID=UPI003714CF21
MNGIEDSLSLTVLSEKELAADRFPGQPVRLLVYAAFAEEDREDEPARVEIRMRPDRLVELARQVRAAQTAMAVAERRRAESEAVQEEREHAAQVALCSSELTDTGTLKRVLAALDDEESGTPIEA